MTTDIPIVSFVGRSGSGKTTLLEKLIRELKQRGYRVAVVKHHYHPDIEFDVPGKDSYRFAQAGADQVVLAGPTKVVHVRQVVSEPTFEEVTGRIRDVDLIITEGYKREDSPKIEVSRAEQGGPAQPISVPAHLIALVTNRSYDVPVPQFGLQDVAALADFIEARFLRRA